MPISSASAVLSSNGGAPEQSASCIVAKSAAGSHTHTIDGFSQIKAGKDLRKPMRSATFTAGGHSWCAECRMIRQGHADWIFMFLCLGCPCPHCSDGEKVSAAYKFSLLDHNGEPSCSISIGVMWTFTKSYYTKSVVPFVETKFFESQKATYLYLPGDCLRVRCDVTVYKEPRCGDRDVPSCLVAVPPPDMGEHLGRLLSSGVGANRTFEIAGGETFAVHRHILAVRSPVLLDELISAAAMKIITEAGVFKTLLHYIYTDSLAEIDKGETSMDMPQHLIAAADRYCLDRLKLICEDKLCRRVDTSTVAATLALAEEYNCRGLKKACFQFLMSGSNLKAAMAAGGFEHLRSSCPSVLKELLAMVDRR